MAPRDGEQMLRGFDLDWFLQRCLPTWADLSIFLCFPFLLCKKNSWEGKRGGGIARGLKVPSSWLGAVGHREEVTC